MWGIVGGNFEHLPHGIISKTLVRLLSNPLDPDAVAGHDAGWSDSHGKGRLWGYDIARFSDNSRAKFCWYLYGWFNIIWLYAFWHVSMSPWHRDFICLCVFPFLFDSCVCTRKRISQGWGRQNRWGYQPTREVIIHCLSLLHVCDAVIFGGAFFLWILL